MTSFNYLIKLLQQYPGGSVGSGIEILNIFPVSTSTTLLKMYNWLNIDSITKCNNKKLLLET